MGWWNNMWAGFGAWWESQAWGNVAEWFAAVGTVGTLAITLFILLRDRRRAAETEAEALTSWYQFQSVHGVRDAIVHFYNAGIRPVTYVALFLASDLNPSEYEWIQVGRSKQTGIAPGESVVHRQRTTAADPNFLRAYVTYLDGSNRRHLRDLRTGAFITGKDCDLVFAAAQAGSDRRYDLEESKPMNRFRAGLSKVRRNRKS